MKANDYQKAAERTMTADTSKHDRLVNAALGLAGESGEVADAVKKYLFHGHTLDRDKVLKELGDIQWYLAQACNALDTTLEEIMQMNIDKLLARYPEGFNFERSINRDE